MAQRWILGPVDSVAIDESGTGTMKIAVPDLVCLFWKDKAGAFDNVSGGIKKAKFHERGVLRKEGEVHTVTIPCCSQW